MILVTYSILVNLGEPDLTLLFTANRSRTKSNRYPGLSHPKD